MSHFALLVLGRVEACEGVLFLDLVLEGDVLDFVASLEAADEDDRDLALSFSLAGDGGLLLSNDPVAVLVQFEIFSPNVGFSIAGQVHGNELLNLSLALDLCLDLKTVVNTTFGVFGEHETEFQVLIVGEVLGVKDELAVEFAGALIDLGVSLEELELHSVSSRVVDGALSDYVVDFHVSAVGCLLNTAVGVVHEAGQSESGKLSDHF